jgi:hypothetical protein
MVRIELYPSTNIPRADLDSIVGDLQNEGITVVIAGGYERRSVDEALPVIIAVATIVAGAGREVARAELVAAMKRFAESACRLRVRGAPPSLKLTIQEPGRELTVNVAADEKMIVRLDDAFVRVTRTDSSTEVWWVQDAGAWLDFYEIIEHQVDQQREQ